MYWLDKFFFIFHTALIVFLLIGWSWWKTRFTHLLASLSVAFSWFVLGIRYGTGYCPCTDWHWQIRAKLGHSDLPHSYIKFLLDTLLGTDLGPALVDSATLLLFLLTGFVSSYLNLRDARARRASLRIST